MPMKFPMDLRLHVARQDMALQSDVVFNAFDAGEPLNGFRRRFALVPPIHRTAQGDASAFNADLNPVPGYRTIPFQRIQRGGGDVRIGPLPFTPETLCTARSAACFSNKLPTSPPRVTTAPSTRRAISDASTLGSNVSLSITSV